MMVTFVSQCEKKSLAKTRRVLDAFANRIGSNTWQTVITKEGLQAVKQLLRKTASKNTAVSCHWLRSRSRSELVWIVGNKDKFNNHGIVPVNYTEQDKFIGEENMNEIYANTQKQPLTQHLFAVGVVAKEIMKSFSSDKQLQKASFIAGCWHDIGKLETQFQNWLNRELKNKKINAEPLENGVHIEGGKGFADFSWDKYPTHNEVSSLIYELLADESSFGSTEQKAIKHAIYWHHAKPFRKNDVVNLEQVEDLLKDNGLQNLASKSKTILQSINTMAKVYFDEETDFISTKTTTDFEDQIEGKELPKYKSYGVFSKLEKYQKLIKNNAVENLIRTALITADQLVSSLTAQDLQHYIDTQTLEKFIRQELLITEGVLKQNIQNCLDGFNDRKNADLARNNAQSKAAQKLTVEDIDIAVLNGPAGCGKTKIALEWALNGSAEQIIWVCPRVAVCQGLYEDLTSTDYLPNATIEIHTGEFKYNNKNKELTEKDYFTGNIVLTTIDQIINGISTHRNITTLTKYMNATVVFDEFHEYIPMDGFNILFAELIACKKCQQNEDTLSNTLLVSATPNHFFIKEFLNISEGDIVDVSSFNDKAYQIEFVDYDETIKDESNPLYKIAVENTFVISNTATTAQQSFIKNQNENSLLIHSKFTPSDKQAVFEKVFASFKESGSHEYDILRSGPIIQAALNISCQNMISEMSSAENTLQRIGRLNRFAEYETATLKIAITEGVRNGKQVEKSAKFLARNHQLQSTTVWYKFLHDKLQDQQNITINQLYNWYLDFYEDEACIKMIAQDFMESLAKSIQVINANIFDPMRIKVSKSKQIKLKRNSLRGNSRFVQMAKYDTQTMKVMSKYLDEPITLGISEITGYAGTQTNLLEFMKKQHHNIIGGISLKRTPDKSLLNIAREATTPIYVSYTTEDLDIINAHAEDDAIYYLQSDKQAIGVMTASKIEQ